MEDRSSELYAVTLSVLVLVWISAFLRSYVRAFIVKSFGVDDWLMIFSAVSLKHMLSWRSSLMLCGSPSVSPGTDERGTLADFSKAHLFHVLRLRSDRPTLWNRKAFVGSGGIQYVDRHPGKDKIKHPDHGQLLMWTQYWLVLC